MMHQSIRRTLYKDVRCRQGEVVCWDPLCYELRNTPTLSLLVFLPPTTRLNAEEIKRLIRWHRSLIISSLCQDIQDMQGQ